MRTSAKKDDPFLSGFNRMINEEESICQQQQQNQCTFNKQLIIELQELVKNYEQLFHKTQLNTDKEILSKIYELIISINNIPMIKEQIDAIKIYQYFLLTSNERDIDIQNAS